MFEFIRRIHSQRISNATLSVIFLSIYVRVPCGPLSENLSRFLRIIIIRVHVLESCAHNCDHHCHHCRSIHAFPRSTLSTFRVFCSCADSRVRIQFPSFFCAFCHFSTAAVQMTPFAKPLFGSAKYAYAIAPFARPRTATISVTNES